MKYILVLLFLPALTNAAAFNDFTTTLEKVGGYSKNSNYESQHCMLHFTDDAPTACGSKSRGVVYLEKYVGNVMCSVALTALVSGMQVGVYSHDECDPIHNSPIIRYLEIKKQ